jgi:protein arginine N-methyltransferase 3
VEGTFFCRKDADNKRELDIELHYEVREPGGDDKGKGRASARVVQAFKVR